MASRILSLVALAAASPATWAFDARQNTWTATHIAIVEGEIVVESWKGDLKPGTKLPDGAVRFTRLSPPPFEPTRQARGEPRPVVAGKRRLMS